MANGNDPSGLTVKELLLELKADVRAIDAKLDAKADRDRVHQLAAEVAAIKLEQSARRHLIDDFRDLRHNVEDLGNPKELKRKVESHERKIWVAYGAWTIVAAGVVANAARIWLGIG